MTAQVGALNKRAVALATDSAVTIMQRDNFGEECKVYDSNNKLFNLSSQHSVGIMIFGSANFVGIPLDNLIGMYRTKLGSRKFCTLKEYADDFQEFIRSGYEPPSIEQQEERMRQRVSEWFRSFIDDMRYSDFDEVLDQDLKEAKPFVGSFIHEAWEKMSQYSFVESSTDEQRQTFWNKYGLMIRKKAQKFFGAFLLDEKSMQELCDIIFGMVFRQIEPDEDTTGIVIAGFGEDELFPSLYKFGINCIGDDKIKVVEGSPTIISDEQNAAIVPFAQDEMVYLFMEGIDFDLQEYALNAVNHGIEELFEKSIKRYLSKDKTKMVEFKKKKDEIIRHILNNYLKDIHMYKQRNHVLPVLKMVGLLPEKELAMLAKSLVDLTALKRRVSMDPGTVGGAIDVALITKSGFEWCAGKHYSASSPMSKT